MNDILPPRRPLSPPPAFDPAPASSPPPPLFKKPRSRKKIILVILAILAALVAIVVAAAIIFYTISLRPVNSATTAKQLVTIEPGSTPSQIAAQLKQKNLIQNQFIFELYARLSGSRNKLQAGSYRLAPSESTQQIVKHIVSGNVDSFSITFFPGATLTDETQTIASKKTDVQTVLRRAGFSQSEITKAFAAVYDTPLFASKPSGTSLEGYVYGETYNFSGDATVKGILQRTFDEYYAQIKKFNLEAGFKKQGLNLYQGITLASIIQREVSGAADQAHVAQVFLTRLQTNEPLGSDVTYQYAAKKLGVAPTPALDSPYNTRKFPGLPPGPIASPGLSALRAVAAPTNTDDLFFLSGDDNVTYFSKTDAEHQSNIDKHCAVKCSTY